MRKDIRNVRIKGLSFAKYILRSYKETNCFNRLCRSQINNSLRVNQSVNLWHSYYPTSILTYNDGANLHRFAKKNRFPEYITKRGFSFKVVLDTVNDFKDKIKN